MTRTLWRVFPWDPEAEEGAPYSASYVPPASGHGRFDLPMGRSRVLHLAETRDHAVAEAIQPLRGRALHARDLERARHTLALCRVVYDGRRDDRIADLCDPRLLADHNLPPDRLASRHRSITQPLALRIWDAGYVGLRWWSSFWGDWHVVVTFMVRAAPTLHFTAPEPLRVDLPAVTEAAALLGIEVVGP